MYNDKNIVYDYPQIYITFLVLFMAICIFTPCYNRPTAVDLSYMFTAVRARSAASDLFVPLL